MFLPLANGRQCSETAGLALDHVKMFCKGGDHKLENLRLMCPAHNRYLAGKGLGVDLREFYQDSV